MNEYKNQLKDPKCFQRIHDQNLLYEDIVEVLVPTYAHVDYVQTIAPLR